jgi:uncharacterized OB-fold protein
MSEYTKKLPVIDDLHRPFWDGCRAGVLKMQRCRDCGHQWWPIGPVCTACLSTDFEWVDLSGRGELWSFIVYHHKMNAAWADDLPYNVALVRLEEGPTMVSNVVGTDLADLEVGLPLEVTFDAVTDEVSIPRFRVVEPAV